MSAGPTFEPAHVGRLILAVAVVVVVSIVAIVVTGDRAVRPDLSAVPLPKGSVTHAAVEDCNDERPPVCTVRMAVGPAGGVDLPRDTEVMLAEHLSGQGWRADEVTGGGARLISPNGRISVRIGDYDADAAPERLDGGVDEDLSREDLAMVTVAPR